MACSNVCNLNNMSKVTNVRKMMGTSKYLLPSSNFRFQTMWNTLKPVSDTFYEWSFYNFMSAQFIHTCIDYFLINVMIFECYSISFLQFNQSLVSYSLQRFSILQYHTLSCALKIQLSHNQFSNDEYTISCCLIVQMTTPFTRIRRRPAWKCIYLSQTPKWNLRYGSLFIVSTGYQ